MRSYTPAARTTILCQSSASLQSQATIMKVEHRKQLVTILQSMPLLGTYRGRLQLLQSAGLEQIIPQIDLEGEPFVVVSQLIQVLEAYGRVSFEHEALGVFLNTVKEFLGAGDENREFIEFLLREYHLMTPVKNQEDLGNWKGEDTPESVLEKIIGENTLRPISFLQRGVEVSRSVALLDVGRWVGTGFMISANLLLTNHHVLPNKELLPQTNIRFNYQLNFAGAAEKIRDYAVETGGVFHTQRALDYTVVEVKDAPGNDWNISILSKAIPAPQSRVNIIQHPAGLPKQISFQNNFVEYADSTRLQYSTSTLNGSSGSPVFNDQWEAVALHRAGGMLVEPGTKQSYFRNEGITIAAILNDLPPGIAKDIQL